jgi:hypothetical protein
MEKITIIFILCICLTGCTIDSRNTNTDNKTEDTVLKNNEKYGNIVNTEVSKKDIGITRQQEVSYKKYSNSRFGFSIDNPDTFITKVVPDNNDGIILASPEGDTELTVSGINNVLNETAQSLYSKLLKEHSNAAYKKQEDNWLIVSWTEGDKIYYQKSIVGAGSIDTFLIKYPIKLKDAYDSIVTHLNLSFKTPLIDISH